MKYTAIIGRILFGLPLAAFGAMGLISVMPDPHAFWDTQEGFSPEAASLIVTMWDSGFLMPLVCITHLVAGLLVVINRFVPLGLAMHLPVSTVMLLFHLFLDPATGSFAYVIFVLNVFLMGIYRDSYSGLLQARAKPGNSA